MMSAGGATTPRAFCKLAGFFVIGKRKVHDRPGAAKQPPTAGRPTRLAVPRVAKGEPDALRLPGTICFTNLLMLPKTPRSARGCEPANATADTAGSQSRSLTFRL